MPDAIVAKSMQATNIQRNSKNYTHATKSCDEAINPSIGGDRLVDQPRAQRTTRIVILLI